MFTNYSTHKKEVVTTDKIKVFSLVIIGNIIDYYDFLLFAHLGVIITPYFLPNLDPKISHLISLTLFALPFIVRPLGGYIFGRIADLIGKNTALNQSIKWAGLATFALALLPTYEYGGIIASCSFIILRALQGFSIGGEYPTAGTFLMERYKNNQGFISSILSASGSIGSLAAFGFAFAYAHSWVSGQFWRVPFLIGGMLSLGGYFLRQHFYDQLKFNPIDISNHQEDNEHTIPYHQGAIVVLFIGALVGVTMWLPMVYTNFYLTKILGASMHIGSLAAFGFAFAHSWVSGQFWRVPFLIGGMLSLGGYFLRQHFYDQLKFNPIDISNHQEDNEHTIPYHQGAIVVLFIGALVGVTMWLPMVYTNFYLTKILGASMHIGILATFIALISQLIVSLIFRILADRYSPHSVMMVAALGIIPLSFLGFYLIHDQNLWGQVVLIIAATSFGAPIHVVMNQLFPKKHKSRNINSFFMIGTAIGILSPALSGYLSERLQTPYVPAIMVSILGFVTFIIFFQILKNSPRHRIKI